jgi:8-oxo-dGTP diphosphatase
MAELATVTLAADAVVFSHYTREPKVLMVRRACEPYLGKLALPGTLVRAGETAVDACMRALREQTGLVGFCGVFSGFYDAPGRDPRGDVRAAVFDINVSSWETLCVGKDVTEVVWLSEDEFDKHNEAYKGLLEDTAFDHFEIVSDMIRRLHLDEYY